MGSPPLARGKVYIQSSSGWCTWDHPRLRGEKFLKKMMICMHIGSPPLARGKAGLDFLVIHGIRITPACAGKSSGYPFWYSVRGDHPRLRGEKLIPCSFTSRWPGITPACAGKSSRKARATPGKWDHPRLRGEKWLCPGPSLRKAGSPPLARGKGYTPLSVRQEVGITPACAGKSASLRGSGPPPRDHPRLRGEKF